jgi:GDPmannose 4,6-dehydratase
MSTAIIFGVTGQDGSYLSELLLAKGYHVIGVSRRVSVPTDERIRHLVSRTKLHDGGHFQHVQGDVTDPFCIQRILALGWSLANPPLEIYNLAAQSHVGTSFEQPTLTTDSTYLGCLNLLEAIRSSPFLRERARFYQASSSEMFGSCCMRLTRTGVTQLPQANGNIQARKLADNSFETVERYQDESTPMLPNSPYAVAKLAAHHLVRVYRESYGLHASSGILFNHESERRGEAFVTRKITKHVAQVAKKSMPKLKLGNLDAQRDWGYAGDYVHGMWLMLQQDRPDDYVLATGETHSVRDFLFAAYQEIGIDLTINFDKYVEIDPALKRPCEVYFLRGDATKAREKLGWVPTVSFEELVKRMVFSDMAKVTS